MESASFLFVNFNTFLKTPINVLIWFTFQVKTGDDIPMPAYFRFLALLAFKIFSDEQVNTFRILIVRQAFTLVMNLDKYMFEPFLICEF